MINKIKEIFQGSNNTVEETKGFGTLQRVFLSSILTILV